MSSSSTGVIHDIALAHGCAHRTVTTPGDGAEGSKTVTKYSLRGLTVIDESGVVHVGINTPFIGLKSLFDTTDDPVIHELLFDSVRVCTHCSSPNCTTLLMAPARTLTLHGQRKKACSMWGQRIILPVNDDNLPACGKIVEQFLSDAEAKAEGHADLQENAVTYTIVPKDECYIAGYRHRHTPISAKDEDVVTALLPKMPELCAALGVPDGGPYAGATADFINGSQYDFIFGVLLDSKPDAARLPEGVVVRKIRAGEWAVYNSSRSQYPSIWRHYTDSFYELEHRGWDASRMPFELYDTDGNWRDVHIPVDADAPADAGKVELWEYRPDFAVAGWERVGEEDHPDWFDNTSIETRLQELLKTPGTARFGSNLHQYYGKPMRFGSFMIVDDTLDIPEDFMRSTIKGGLWRINSNRHFNGGSGEGCYDMDAPYKQPFEKQSVCLDHPRVFATKYYDARGGYDETWIPMRLRGKLVYECIELPPLKVFAKLEDPLNGNTVPDEELGTYYHLPGNAHPGTLIVGYKPAFFDNNDVVYAAPLVKGVIASDSAAPPDGFEVHSLDGGKFVKITEVNPDGSLYLRGEPGWEVEFIVFPDKAPPEISHSTDFSRHCRMLQTGGGMYYELYVPVGQSKLEEAK